MIKKTLKAEIKSAFLLGTKCNNRERRSQLCERTEIWRLKNSKSKPHERSSQDLQHILKHTWYSCRQFKAPLS